MVFVVYDCFAENKDGRYVPLPDRADACAQRPYRPLMQKH